MAPGAGIEPARPYRTTDLLSGARAAPPRSRTEMSTRDPAFEDDFTACRKIA